MKKRFGQHFIHDRRLLQRIVAFCGVGGNDTVVEIGPGAGALTQELAAVASRVIAIEIDRDLIAALRAAMPSNVSVIEADALEADYAGLTPSPFSLVGNLPYNVGTPLLKRFIAARRHITAVTVMLQKEVAERIRAAVGSAAYGPLSVLVQYYATPVWGFAVPPGAFTPRPKVDSAVIRLEWIPGVGDNPAFTDFAHHAFGSRRKKLLNNLAAIFPTLDRQQLLESLEAEGIDAGARPENVSIAEYLRLHAKLREFAPVYNRRR